MTNNLHVCLSFDKSLASCMLLPGSVTSSFTLSIHLFLCLPASASFSFHFRVWGCLSSMQKAGTGTCGSGTCAPRTRACPRTACPRPRVLEPHVPDPHVPVPAFCILLVCIHSLRWCGISFRRAMVSSVNDRWLFVR